jgi:hypothetical protein
MPNPKKHFDTPCPHCGKVAAGCKIYCNNKCQMAYQRSLKIKAWLNGEFEGGNWQGVSSSVRHWLFERCQNKCELCGWGEVNPTSGRVPLQVNHKDGNPDNHRPENLELICPNCHSLTPTFGNLNRGNGRKLRYNKPL